jgi:hypothetical protein
VGKSRDLSSGILCALAAALLLDGCTRVRVTEPEQTATEQLLVSSAVDHALAAIKPPIPPGSKVYVDSEFFDTDKVVLPKYTIAAVRDLILHSGGDLVADRASADLVVELRNGAQSINHKTLLVGIPALPIPIPLAGTVKTPEIALFKHDEQRGISKVALTIYGAKTGALAGSTAPVFGASHNTDWTVLLLFNWTTQNIMPENIPPDGMTNSGTAGK